MKLLLIFLLTFSFQLQAKSPLTRVCSILSEKVPCLAALTAETSVFEVTSFLEKNRGSVVVSLSGLYPVDWTRVIAQKAKASGSRFILVVEEPGFPVDWLKAIAEEGAFIHMTQPSDYPVDWIRVIASSAASKQGLLILDVTSKPLAVDWLRSIVEAGAVLRLNAGLAPLDWIRVIAAAARKKMIPFYLYVTAPIAPDWLRTIAQQGPDIFILTQEIQGAWARDIAESARENEGTVFFSREDSRYDAAWIRSITEAGGRFVSTTRYFEQVWMRQVVSKLMNPNLSQEKF